VLCCAGYWKQLENKQEMKASRFMKWNNCITEDYKGCMLQMLQSQNYGLQQLTKVEGSMCTQKPWKERMKDNSKPLHYILSPNPKVAAT
jgi:hypothetical protein